MPRPSSLSPDNILRFLQVTGDAASANEIGAALHVGKAGRKPLFNMLMKLKKRGAIAELPGGRYRLSGRKGGEDSPSAAARSDGDSRGIAGSARSGSGGTSSTVQGATANLARSADSHSLARDEVR